MKSVYCLKRPSYYCPVGYLVDDFVWWGFRTLQEVEKKERKKRFPAKAKAKASSSPAHTYEQEAIEDFFCKKKKYKKVTTKGSFFKQ